MSPIVILPAEAPPPPSGLFGVVYQDTFGGLSLTHMDIASTTWTGAAAVMWSGLDQSPWSTVAINTTVKGTFCSGATYSDLTYCATTDELYWPGAGAANIERVKRSNGSSVASITPPAPVHSIAYDKINDEFHVSQLGASRGCISSFISRANLDAGTYPTGGVTVYQCEQAFPGFNGQEQPGLAWDEVGSGTINGPHPGTLYALACGYGGVAYFTDWTGEGLFNTWALGSASRSIEINNNTGSTHAHILDPSAGASVIIRRFGINPFTGGAGTATLSATELPNYDSSGFVYLYEYT